MEEKNKVALLEEELIQLTVKSSLVTPSENRTLIYSVWTKKTYNPDSLRVQLRSIWKTKKKFEIVITGIGHWIKDCTKLHAEDRTRVDDEQPFSLALNTESSIVGKGSLILGSMWKKSMKQCFYTREEVIENGVTLLKKLKMSHWPKKEVNSKKNSMNQESKKMQGNF
ncbi:hypothetical protein J1N35_028833 [Gossypium stocksii]|uniref:Uncharacterized protein n=1 Tax=Gossypium stocksii TaxID=47602 RepID=A0A9D3ZRH6_9ROSI|nr:hypothetical protein J1N35_028833 [Gossypium stocksii]